jgi:hypothetical protein
MATKTVRDERIRSLELAIEEQRRDYDVISNLYSQAKNKNVTFLAAALALLTYLYGSVNDGITLAEKLFIPKEPYGAVIYFLSLTMFLVAIALQLFALKPRQWLTAYDNDQEKNLLDNYEEYLVYIQDCYLKCSRVNCASYAKKQILLDMSFNMMLMSGTILLLLKIFR